MKALNFIIECNELFKSVESNLDLIDNYKVDYYDFNNNSFADFIDYISFMGFSEYDFITLTKVNRLNKFAKYLSNKLKISFKVKSYSNFINNLRSEDSTRIETFFDRIPKSQKKADCTKALNNGYKSCMCGLYPLFLRKGLIKHIFIDNLADISKIDETILINMAVNSEIIFKKNLSSRSKKLENLPLIFNAQVKFKTIQSDLKIISNDTLFKSIKNFINTGHIDLLSPYIEDYGYITGIDNFHSLKIIDNKYYLDNNKVFILGNINQNYKELINNYSMITQNNVFNEFNPALLRLLPFLIEIENIYGEPTTFITPYNYYHTKPVEHSFENTNWIGFSTKEHKYVYSLVKKKLFNVNANFLNNVELIIKNNADQANDISLIQKVQEKLDNV